MTKIIFPEAILFITMIGVVLGEIGYLREKMRLSTPVAVIGLLGCIGSLFWILDGGSNPYFGGGYYFDRFAFVLKLLILISSVISMLSISFSSEIHSKHKTEAQALILGLSLIACVLVSSGNLIVTFVSLTSMWMVAAVLAGINTKSTKSNEAAIKTLAMGFVSAVLFVLGSIVLAKHTGSFYLHEVHARVPIDSSAGIISFWLILIGMAIQIGFFPVHYLVPDLADGSPTPIAAILNAVLRLTGFAVVARLWLSGFRDSSGSSLFDWLVWLQIVSAVTLLVGSFLALGQTRAKRLIGALILVESGFMMLGFSVLNSRIMGAALFSLFVQTVGVLGVYYTLGFLMEAKKSDEISSFRGVVEEKPFYSVVFVLLVASVAAFPPFPSFFARFAMISSVVGSGQFVLGAISTLGVGFCWVAAIRLIAPMIEGALKTSQSIDHESIMQSQRVGAPVVAAIIVAVLFILTLFSNRIIQQSIRSIESIF